MIKQITDVPIKNILFDDFTFSVWRWSDYSKVKESIKEIGVQTPPVIVHVRENVYKIVSGHKRLRALRDLKRKSARCVVINDDFDANQLYINTINENLTFREYNLIEKGLILNKLDAITSCGDHVEKLKQRLCYDPNNYNRIKMLARLSEETQKAIACGKVRETTAFYLVEISPENQKQFLKIMEVVEFGQNKQMEVLTLLRDLSRMEKKSFKNIFSEQEMKKILSNSKWNPPQKGLHIRQYLQKRRFPNLFSHQKEFERLKSKLAAPATVKILSTAPFEGDNLRLEIAIGGRNDLADVAEWMEKIRQHEDIENFINIARGEKSDKW